MFVNLAKDKSLMLGMKNEEVLKICSLPCLNILYKIGIFSEWNIPFYFRGKFYQRRWLKFEKKKFEIFFHYIGIVSSFQVGWLKALGWG
jgi:hypothetical protein